MPEQNDHIIDGKAAPYPKTSTPEIESRDIFHSLLNRQYVKGDINVMDKVPNSDGILEMTDKENYPVGKIDVQLKTLGTDYITNPKYQCPISFFAYCGTAALPVIIVVVDRQNKKAYWRHIDLATLQEVKENMRGESYLLSISAENCIDGRNESYIDAWTHKAKEAWQKVWNFDSEAQRKKELEEKLKEFESKLQNPVNLPAYVLKEIHQFLDEYNYILDKEFGAVKLVLYPDYWKIGMGIIKYEFNDIRFILFPVEFDKSQLLIKEVEPSYDWFGKEMVEGNVLLWTGMKDTEDITRYRIPYSYRLLEDSIMRVAGKYNFPLPDLFIANEYVISFIDKYQQYLNMEKGEDTYLLKDLKYMLYSVIPMLVATTHNYADHVVRHNHSIDSYDSFRAYEGHRKKISEAIKKINEGFQPKVTVTVTSERFNIDLIHYYIRLLESKGFNVAKRLYRPEQRNEQMYNVELWKTWNKEVLWHNIQLFLQQFYRLYRDYIHIHFTHIVESLKIVENDEITTIHILHFDEAHTIPPRMEVYHLRPEIPETGKVLCFLAEDPANPIDRKKYFIDSEYDCVIGGKRYQMIRMHAQPLDFLFSKSPTYGLINDKLTDRLGEFFRERKRKL